MKGEITAIQREGHNSGLKKNASGGCVERGPCS